MDLAKLVDLLQQYPGWFRSLFALWLVAGAALCAGLFLLRGPQPTAASIAGTPPSAPAGLPPTSTQAPIARAVETRAVAESPDEYAAKLQSLSDRFLEKQEFIELHQGATVAWEGHVERVSQHTESQFVTLWLKAGEGRTEISVLVSLPDSLRTKAFSLQRGDVVRARGKLSLSTPNMPDLDATELVVIKPRGGG